jgi:hypothetical protein
VPDKGKPCLSKKQGKGGSRIAVPATKNTIPSDLQPPIFSLQYLQKDYCVRDCQLSEKAEFAEQLRQLSELPWRQLRNAPRHGVGYEKISQQSIKVAIPSHITADVNLIAFRFSGQKPMIGYRDGRTFYVIWLDRGFSVYDHG